MVCKCFILFYELIKPKDNLVNTFGEGLTIAIC